MIQFNSSPEGIIISIPKEIISHAANGHPVNPMVILDDEGFFKDTCFQLEHGLHNAETGLTKFQELFDEAMEEACISGNGNADFKE